jgi:flagellar protein FlaF
MYATNAATAYANVATTVLDPRGIEQRIFQQANGRLMAARDPAAPFTILAEAIHINTQLWTLLAVDVLSDENTLPQSLRAQIASLAIYSQKTGRAVLQGNATVDDLIEINSAMIAGLDGDPGPAPALRSVK